MRPRSAVLFFAKVSALASLAVTAPARAGGAVLPRTGSPEPLALDVRVAVAATATGSVRWNEITVPPSTSLMWLVPVRPGAAVDWTGDEWLAALDDATAPRVLPPSAPASCPVPMSAERTTSWASPAPARRPTAVTVHTTSSAAREHAAELGYEVSPQMAARIDALSAKGFGFVALELASSWGRTSSGTLRVADDAGAVLPLAITGTRAGPTRVTAFTIGPGVAAVPGTRDVDPSSIQWGATGSDYARVRRDLLESSAGDAWLRESASHNALFTGTAVLGGSPAPSLVVGYFASSTCASSARSVGTSFDAVGVACAPGNVARVPGGAPCTPSPGAIDPARLSCGQADDLALALAGVAPGAAVVTRWAGIVPAGALGVDLPIAFDPTIAQRYPVVRAASIAGCGSVDPPLAPEPSSPGGGGGSSSGTSTYDPYYAESGCGGSTTSSTTVYYEDEVDSEPPPDDTSDGCSGGTTSTSTEDDGWDSEDSEDGWDSDDSSDGCGGGDTSSSDSCSGGSSSSSSSGGSDDGWDTEDEMSPQAKKTHARVEKKKRRTKSPVSRWAMLAALLLLPLRRRARGVPPS